MVDELLDRGLTPKRIRDLAVRLSLAPWLWPVDETSSKWERARELHPSGRPNLRPGEVLLLACNPAERSGGLYHLSLGGEAAGTGVPTFPFGMAARRAWDTALVGLNRSLPFLWSSFEKLRPCPEAAIYLTSCVLNRPGESLQEDSLGLTNRLVDGPSFGLTFALGAGSTLWRMPLPVDLAATGKVESDGRVTAVDGIELKVHVLLSRAPSVSRLLVPRGNMEEATAAAAGTCLTIVGVGSVAEALDLAFDLSSSPGRLLGVWLRPDEQAQLADRLFELALAGRQAAVFWPPIEKAAELALEQWMPQETDVREKLQFARHVAARHEGRTLSPAWKANPVWLAALPRTLRKELLAHEVQQSADMGDPEPEQVLELAWTQVEKTPDDRGPDDLKILGALARLLAVYGRPEDGLRLAEQATKGWLALHRGQDSSYALCTWYRLAGVLSDLAALSAAEGAFERIDQMAGLDPGAALYVALPRHRAHLLHDPRNEEHRRKLLFLAQGKDESGTLVPDMPPHLKWSALRWYVRLYPADSATPDLRSALCQASAADPHDLDDAAGFHLLVELDKALASGNRADAQSLLSSLLAGKSSGLINLLVQTSRRLGQDEAAYLAEWYPY